LKNLILPVLQQIGQEQEHLDLAAGIRDIFSDTGIRELNADLDDEELVNKHSREAQGNPLVPATFAVAAG
jgi:hypothetical protein